MPKREERSALEDLRCLCGSLVAKVRKDGIELKCRRCKRVALIPFSADEQVLIEESHSDLFRYQFKFDHSHTDLLDRSETAKGLDESQ